MYTDPLLSSGVGGRNRPQPQPYSTGEMRMAGDHAAGDDRKRIGFYRLGRWLLNSASVRSPGAAPTDLLPWEVERPRVLVARRDAALLGCWSMRLGGKRNRMRAMSPPEHTRHLEKEKENTLAEPSDAYLVKQGSLFSAPGTTAGMQWADASEAIRSISNAPKKDLSSANA